MALRWLTLVALVGCDGELRFAPETAPDTAPADVAAADSTSAKCTSDAQCAFASLHCDLVSGTCFACLRDDHCASSSTQRRCDVASRRCVECGVSADCDTDETCEPSTHRCVRDCADGGPCSIEQPSCDPKRLVCTCTAPSCSVGERTQCDPVSGQCVECLVDAHCGPDEPRCVDTNCHACRSNDDCAGKRCDVVTFTCVD